MNNDYNVVENISVASDFDNLALVEGLIDRTCSNCGISEDNYGNVLIAVTEAFNNAVVHGNGNDISKQVVVSVCEKNDSLFFSVKDSGNGFDYAHIADPTAPENIEKENGRGIYLMRHLADEVEFLDEGRVVNIHFYKQ